MQNIFYKSCKERRGNVSILLLQQMAHHNFYKTHQTISFQNNLLKISYKQRVEFIRINDQCQEDYN